MEARKIDFLTQFESEIECLLMKQKYLSDPGGVVQE
jgi:hypothetical protein